MSDDKKIRKSIRAVMPSVVSFQVDYEDESDLKTKICKKLDIEPEFTNLIFVEREEDLTPIENEEPRNYNEQEDESKPTNEVIIDYLWARQMIALKDSQKKLRKASALVVGAGALGNEIVKNLVKLGFGEIKIVDYDVVEFSNVSRGSFEKEDVGRNKAEVLAEKTQKRSPFAKISFIPAWVEECDADLLRSNVIISALDNMVARIWLASFCVKHAIPLVDGGIREFQGRIQTYLPESPCLACGIPLEKYTEIMELKNPCEDYENDAVASFSTVASIVAGVQANEAMKIISGLPTLKGVLLMDFLKNNYFVMPLERNRTCFVCGKDAVKEVSVKKSG